MPPLIGEEGMILELGFVVVGYSAAGRGRDIEVEGTREARTN
jgi:hypothetical protein